jgi:alkylated DNA repair protein alkB homolog 8
MSNLLLKSEDTLDIESLHLIKNFITVEEEKFLLQMIYKEDWDTSIKRRVIHFGHIFHYKNKKVNKSNFTGFPSWIEIILNRLKNIDILKKFIPDQCTINEYLPGIGISSHIDTHSSFTDNIISISLGSPIVMKFIDKTNNQTSSMYLPERSLLVLSGEARYKYSHGISWRKTDCNPCGEIIKRRTRVSITLRNIRKNNEPCNCKWPNLCDSQEGILGKTRL